MVTPNNRARTHTHTHNTPGLHFHSAMSGRPKIARVSFAKTAKVQRNAIARQLKQHNKHVSKPKQDKPRSRRPTIMEYLMFDRSAQLFVPVTLTHRTTENGTKVFRIIRTKIPDDFDGRCPVCSDVQNQKCLSESSVCSVVRSMASELLRAHQGTVVLRKHGDYRRVNYAGLVPLPSTNEYVFCLASGRDA